MQMSISVELKKQMLKIPVMGITGSGKTSFCKTVFGDFEANEAPRHVFIESETEDTFMTEHQKDFLGSTTTISFNQIGLVFIMYKYNHVEIIQYGDFKIDILNDPDVEKVYSVSVFDVAGQERFDFMWDIVAKGANAVIYMADGTNIASIQHLIDLQKIIKKEEKRKGRKIASIIFLNKSDLANEGIYIGKDAAVRMLSETELANVPIFETNIYDPESYNMGLRYLLEQLSMYSIRL